MNKISAAKISALAAAIALFLYFGLRSSGLTDEQQIIAVLNDISSAAARQSAEDVFSHLNSQFTIEGLDRRTARFELQQFFNRNTSTNVVFSGVQLAIQDKTAILDADTDVSGQVASSSPATLYHGRVEIFLAKEETRRFLLFPHTVWKIAKVTAPGVQSLAG